MIVVSGYQVAIMAPTELLAEQHYRSFSHWFKDLAAPVYLLTSQKKAGGRKEILSSLGRGEAGITVGTHALFQEQVSFQQLGLVIIDEQHRFGVHQR